MNLFVYGTLMDPEIMRKVSGQKHTSKVATLDGFMRKKIKDEVFPAMIPQQGSRVAGLVYFNVPTESQRRLDQFEGAIYQKEEVLIFDDKNQPLRAQTYVLSEKYLNLLSEQDWDFDEFKLNNKHLFQKKYVDHI
ncbi:gamma-glutamylcyclotransferase family protein [Methylophaga nitratireducenticrescens]|uniref:gamma-glutamylcyclotransferase family protein n=1 Tax=Methylophaga nitratireducenticrescens TaxID=754476 RepID=UPI000CDCB2B5|nr:gamma-glutamylcyclotransferase family protein [Methylophaga nitratireducenticrescens]AUZ85825.1 hypothetical protein CDW43_15190 [Methylophaga nitratireducenticrescens]